MVGTCPATIGQSCPPGGAARVGGSPEGRAGAGERGGPARWGGGGGGPPAGGGARAEAPPQGGGGLVEEGGQPDALAVAVVARVAVQEVHDGPVGPVGARRPVDPDLPEAAVGVARRETQDLDPAPDGRVAGALSAGPGHDGGGGERLARGAQHHGGENGGFPWGHREAATRT